MRQANWNICWLKKRWCAQNVFAYSYTPALNARTNPPFFLRPGSRRRHQAQWKNYSAIHMRIVMMVVVRCWNPAGSQRVVHIRVCCAHSACARSKCAGRLKRISLCVYGTGERLAAEWGKAYLQKIAQQLASANVWCTRPHWRWYRFLYKRSRVAITVFR